MNSIVWDYDQLIERVRQLRSTSDLELYLNSLAWKYEIFGYHNDESLRLVGAACPTHFNLPPDDTLSLHAEAHVIAAAQVSHSMADVMAHVVHYAVGLNLTGKKLEDLSFKSVVGHLTGPTHSNLKAQIDSCRSTPQFRYIEAFVNVTKHRRLVSTTARVTTNQAHALSAAIHIEKVSHKGSTFPATTSQGFLEMMHKVIEDVVDVGRALDSVI